MVLVGQPVEDRHTGVFGEVFDGLLRIAAELDRVVHAPEHPGRVLDRFFMANLRASRVEIGDMRALIMAGDLESTARARRGLLEDQNDFLALQVLLFGTGVFGPFQVAGEIEQVLELALGKILHRQAASDCAD
jgi:hypothetical protein